MTAAPRRTVVTDPARDTAWEDRAACLNEDPDLFFPPGSDWKGHEDQEAAAKAVCNRCPVLDQCREKALADSDFEGIRGGLTGEERKALARARRNAARKPIKHGTTTGNRAHYKRAGKPCRPCADAVVEDSRQRREAKAS